MVMGEIGLGNILEAPLMVVLIYHLKLSPCFTTKKL